MRSAEVAKRRQVAAGHTYGEKHPKQELVEIFPQALAESGQIRHKTGAQIYAEGVEYAAIEADLAKRRMLAALGQVRAAGFRFREYSLNRDWDLKQTVVIFPPSWVGADKGNISLVCPPP